MMVQWADSHTESKQLRLQDQLSIPWQRLMRYRLLLKGILRHTEKPANFDTDRRTSVVNQKGSMKQMVYAGEKQRFAHIFVGCTLLSGCGLARFLRLLTGKDWDAGISLQAKYVFWRLQKLGSQTSVQVFLSQQTEFRCRYSCLLASVLCCWSMKNAPVNFTVLVFAYCCAILTLRTLTESCHYCSIVA